DRLSLPLPLGRAVLVSLGYDVSELLWSTADEASTDEPVSVDYTGDSSDGVAVVDDGSFTPPP
ncbi:hypothetical protein PF005_g25483, partial [Phytophthora fragariae]